MTDKLKWLLLTLLATGAIQVRSEPTIAELRKAAPMVQSRLSQERRLYAIGAMTREQVGDAAMREAKVAQNDAERALMLTGAMVFYAKARVSRKAVEAFRSWRVIMTPGSSRDVDSCLTFVASAFSDETYDALKTFLSVVWWHRIIPGGKYWNVELSDCRMKLLAHEENGRLCVQPLSQKTGFVDLTKPIVTENDRKITIDAVGDHLESYKTIPHETWRWDDNLPKGTLTGVKLPDTLKHIYASAFEGCVNLKAISLPEGVESTCRRSFAGCTGLREICLPLRMNKICGEAFCGCTSLQCLEIPATVTYIGARAFADCTTLRRVRFLGQETSAEDDAFQGSPCDADIVRKPKRKRSEASADMCLEFSNSQN